VSSPPKAIVKMSTDKSSTFTQPDERPDDADVEVQDISSFRDHRGWVTHY
jgi:hypothetical protein